MIELYDNTNTCRKRIAEIEPKEIDVSNPSGVLLKIYQESGYPNAIDEKRLYAVSDGAHVCFSEVQSLENVSRIYYADVVAPQNAVEVGREDGIRYFFHSSEKPHSHFPHVHAEYAGEEICIGLKDCSIAEGKFESRKREKEAVAFVEGKIDELWKTWNDKVKTT